MRHLPGGTFRFLAPLLSIVAANGFVPKQLDVKAAFLYGELKETIYMRLPEGYWDGNKVAHLKRCTYGLKLTTRVWKDQNMPLLTTIQTNDDIR
jgi:hypothetical protein